MPKIKLVGELDFELTRNPLNLKAGDIVPAFGNPASKAGAMYFTIGSYECVIWPKNYVIVEEDKLPANDISSKKPLDDFVEIIQKQFPKYVFIEETKENILRMEDSALFKKEGCNEYCFLEYKRNSGNFNITLFKSDSKDFEIIENHFLEGLSFAVNKSDLETIMNCIV